MLNGEAHEIIGVLGEDFRPIVNRLAEIWRPTRINTANPSRGAIVLRAVARLPEDVPLERAQAAADILARQLEAAHPQFNEKTRFNLMPLHQRVVGDIKPGLLALLGAVGFVLLIACANIANLLLARGSARGREIAVRVALGAARGRVVRQLLTESVSLAVIGGVSGLLVGVWAVDALVALAPPNTPRLNEIRLDPTVMTFASVLTIATGILFGLAPALQGSRGGVTNSLKDVARGSASVTGRGLRRALIAVEVALALMLLTGAGLLTRTFVHLRATDLGFKPDNLLTGFVNLPRAAGYDTPAKYQAFFDQVFEKARAIPGVQNAALASVLPLSGDSDTSFMIEGRPMATSQSETPVTWYREVSASYFETMGIPIKRGRSFAAREASPSVVVNETFARTYFPGQDPLGRRIRFQADQPWFAIVGIVGDVRVSGARKELKVETYIPYWQQTSSGTTIILKAGNPALLAAPLRQAVAAVDRNVPVSGITMLADMVSDSIDDSRFFATLAVGFAVLAVLLAAIGIYGVMAYAVSQRTTEIGVRMALGATPSEVFGLVVGDGLRLAAIGVVAGVTGSLLTGHWLTSLLFGVKATDPATLTVAACVLLVVALVACFLPARRATRVDPMVALRTE
jgi:putative ABC transport system permease protein